MPTVKLSRKETRKLRRGKTIDIEVPVLTAAGAKGASGATQTLTIKGKKTPAEKIYKGARKAIKQGRKAFGKAWMV